MRKRSIKLITIGLLFMFGFAVVSTWASYEDKKANIDPEILVADLPDCVETGQPCVKGGTPCCDSTKSCTGTFPNFYCQ